MCPIMGSFSYYRPRHGESLLPNHHLELHGEKNFKGLSKSENAVRRWCGPDTTAKGQNKEIPAE